MFSGCWVWSKESIWGNLRGPAVLLVARGPLHNGAARVATSGSLGLGNEQRVRLNLRWTGRVPQFWGYPIFIKDQHQAHLHESPRPQLPTAVSSPSTQKKAWEPTHAWKACISGHTHHPVSEGRWAKVQAWKEVQIRYSSTLRLRAGPPNHEQHDISCSYFVFSRLFGVITIWWWTLRGGHIVQWQSAYLTCRHPSELRSSDSHWCQPEATPRL